MVMCMRLTLVIVMCVRLTLVIVMCVRLTLVMVMCVRLTLVMMCMRLTLMMAMGMVVSLALLQSPHLGGCGLTTSSLSQGECRLVQRFDPNCLAHDAEKQCDSDTIGFFIAKFRKKER